jgi:hypothetical protein
VCRLRLDITEGRNPVATLGKHFAHHLVEMAMVRC